MFILFLATTVICLAAITLIKCSSVKKIFLRYFVRIIAVSFICVSILVIAVDIPTYIKGCNTETGSADLIKYGPIEIFSVEGATRNYWRIEFDKSSDVDMYIHQNPTNMEIRYNSLNNISQYPVVLSYLPMSKFVTEIKVIFQEKEFTYAFQEPFDDESRLMCFILMLSIVWLVVILIKKLVVKRKNKYENLNLR